MEVAMTKLCDCVGCHETRAREVSYRLIRSGLIIRQPCEVCGNTSDAHHEDYDNPLDIRWLCRSHHRSLHHTIVRLALAEAAN